MNKPPLSEGQIVDRLKKHHEQRLLDRIREASRERDKQLPAISTDIARDWMREHKLIQSLGQPPEHCQWVIKNLGTIRKSR